MNDGSPLSSHDDTAFEKVRIGPLDCVAEGARLLQGHYLLFVAMVFLLFLAAQIPFHLVSTPLYLGAMLCLCDLERGRQPTLSRFIDGFHRFGDAAIAAVILTVSSLLVTLPLMLFVFVGMGITVEFMGEDSTPLILVGFVLAGMAGYGLASALLFVPLAFLIPLMADRGLSAGEAIGPSVRAGKSHFFGLLALGLGISVTAFLSSLLCIPLFFVGPFLIAAHHVAYRKVFPLLPEDPAEDAGGDPLGPEPALSPGA